MSGDGAESASSNSGRNTILGEYLVYGKLGCYDTLTNCQLKIMRDLMRPNNVRLTNVPSDDVRYARTVATPQIT